MATLIFVNISFLKFPQAHAISTRPRSLILRMVKQISLVLGSSKFIKFCGRIAIAHGVRGAPPTDLNKVDCHGFSEHRSAKL